MRFVKHCIWWLCLPTVDIRVIKILISLLATRSILFSSWLGVVCVHLNNITWMRLLGFDDHISTSTDVCYIYDVPFILLLLLYFSQWSLFNSSLFEVYVKLWRLTALSDIRFFILASNHILISCVSLHSAKTSMVSKRMVFHFLASLFVWLGDLLAIISIIEFNIAEISLDLQ